MMAQTGRELKQLGLDLVIENSGAWREYIIEKFKAFCKVRKELGHPRFRMEEFREVAIKQGWDMPHSHKAWGALPRIVCKMGLIKPTKEYAPAVSKKTHGHMVRLWQII